ncbi:MAG TPA: type II secretion system major pseudopilin GspG [Candidatus Margulisiibacteriota bacterium]|nr:type II secretion system major pseudopilin GspG [Candidatus Margulisiibacteriota bacterium]
MKKILFSLVSLLIFLSLVFSAKPAESKTFAKGKQNSGGSKTEAEIKEAETMLETIKFVLEHYKLDNGMYPTTEQGLEALVKETTIPPLPHNWRGAYLGRILMDPWGKPYNYLSPGAHNKNSYDLSSYGPDGVESNDDITNW